MAVQRNSALKTISFNPYAAGSKIYSQVSSAPNIGPVDKAGYAERDRAIKARKNAVLAKMKAINVGAYASPAALRGVN